MNLKTLQPPRPVFLNPMRIRMPVGACTSIAHRISGLLMAAGVPIGIVLLHMSSRNEADFERVRTLLGLWPATLLVSLMVWALAHHVLAGVRHLLTDFGIGSSLKAARRSAWTLNVAALVIALAAAGVMW
jgi:succinate dehydrogenase / fumarate reductase cytochrome b subunit